MTEIDIDMLRAEVAALRLLVFGCPSCLDAGYVLLPARSIVAGVMTLSCDVHGTLAEIAIPKVSSG